MQATHPQGLEAVTAAESAITWIDGAAGQIRYRGYPIGELADNCTFEDVAYLLWHGELPGQEERSGFRDRLVAARLAGVDLLPLLLSVPRAAHPLDVLRYAVSWDALRNPFVWKNDRESNLQKSIEMAGWFPVVIAGYHRARRGEPPVFPRADLDSAANFLYMLHGVVPDHDVAAALDTSLVLHADHELNASTFAARVTIATQSNLHAAIASALGTLSGPRHGGASDRVIDMLEEIGSPENVEEWAARTLARKERVMGFGHRVYRTVDPRSRHLRSMAERVLRGTDRERWIEILQRLEAVMQREKNLYPNVDLYAALVNRQLGIEPDFYTSVFAVSRIVGWTAHAMEQLHGRMIRPVARYVGPPLRHVEAVGA